MNDEKQFCDFISEERLRAAGGLVVVGCDVTAHGAQFTFRQVDEDGVAGLPLLADVKLKDLDGVVVDREGKARAIIVRERGMSVDEVVNAVAKEKAFAELHGLPLPSPMVRPTGGSAMQIASMLATMNPGSLAVRSTSRGQFLKVDRSFKPAWLKRNEKAARYEPCPCGSGVKFKFCCGR